MVLMEAAEQVGGRARRAYYGGRLLDNGQHLFLGAYRETLALLERIGVGESQVFRRRPLQMCIRSRQRDIHLKLSHYPAPLHLVRGLQSMSGLTMGERLRAVRLGLALAGHHFTLKEDVSVAHWLERHHQSPALIHNIWEPLCLATLNTPIRDASAQVFLRILHDAFLRHREDSDLLIPRTGLSALLPDPATDYIQRHGGTVRLGCPVNGLEIEDNTLTGVTTPYGSERAEHVIMAVPSRECRRLTQPHVQLQAISDGLARLTAAPIYTVYLEYPRPVQLEAPLVGIVNDTSHWVFDHNRIHQRGLISVVLSGPGPHTELDNDTLIRKVADELAYFYPRWPPHDNSVLIREDQATFACRTGISAVRPQTATPLRGCWLAGDYIDTGYPATLEGAVLSGVRSAHQLMQSLH